MENLKDILGGVKAAEAEAKLRLAQARIEKQQAIQEIAEALKAGEKGTGNRLHDNLILMYGDWLIEDEQIVSRYERVNESLKGKSGEPVVMIRRWLEDIEHIFGSGGRKPRQGLFSRMSVGVLQGEKIIFADKKTEAFLPTSKYIEESRNYKVGATIFEGNMLVDGVTHLIREPCLGGDLDCEIEWEDDQIFVAHPSGNNKAMEVVTGYQQINDWLAEDGALGNAGRFFAIRDYCNRLGIRPVGTATNYQARLLKERMGIRLTQ